MDNKDNHSLKDNFQKDKGNIAGHGKMIVVTDNDGNLWLCDKNVDKGKDLKNQGCWRWEK